MENSVLVLKIKQGDQDAFNRLFHSYHKRLVAYAYAYTRDINQAEDIAQEAFVRFWNSRDKLEESQPAKQLLFTIAHRIFIDQYRQQKRHTVLLDDLKEEVMSEIIQEGSDEFEGRLALLKKFKDELPDRCREVLHMSKVEGYSYREIAEILDISVKSVESQMRLAYQKIRLAFGKK
jgi:RNA polymerase sigma-70 factor (ECF subfamily)